MAEWSKVANVASADLSKLNSVAKANIASILGLTTPANGWDISGLSYDSVSENNTEESSPRSVAFNATGTKMFILGPADIYQYTLSPAWDITSSSYDTVSLDFSTHALSARDFAFGNSGTRLYIADTGAGGDIVQYTLGTAYSLSGTVTYNTTYDCSSEDSLPLGLAFSSDGTKMFIGGDTNKAVFEYSVSSAWNLAGTVTYSGNSVSTNTAGSPAGTSLVNNIRFSTDGVSMFMVSRTTNKVRQWTLGTAWSLAGTVTLDLVRDISESTGSGDGDPQGMAFKPDGTKMYIQAGGTTVSNDTTYQYSTGV